MSIKLSDIARWLDVPFSNDDRVVARIASLESAGPDDLVYVTGEKYLDRLARSQAGVVVVPVQLALPDTPGRVVLRVPDPEIAIGLLLERFAPAPARPPIGVHASAVIDPSAKLGANLRVGPNVYVAENAVVGEGAILHANVVVGAHSAVGESSELHANVVLLERVHVGKRVVLHAGVVVGADGFGYRWDGKRHVKIPQIGIVVIEDDVEVGANTCIDRAKFGETRIGPGTKIDNLVQVGHNVVTGAHCILCGQVALAGSTTLGNGVIMGGSSASAGHLHIADGTMLAARAAVASNTSPKEILAGSPAVPHKDWLRQKAAVRGLPDLVKRVRALEAELERIKGQST